ncbi:MAG: hypothetical protein US82_C0041G0012 [Parcubacteria group bacterium GW2011_GWC1_38_22]|nr:MAG: hypothetical protein US82_C0041G0012 [Parcubacteria group bacterium GW2011_GWC1_38_22]
MKTFICEICGDAYIGTEKPSKCPFCGANHNFIKEGKDAKPVVENKEQLSEQSKNNLEQTLQMEIEANAIYLCMAGKTKSYEIMKMYKRLAKIELEHATIAIKLLGIPMPEIKPELCSDEDTENFEKTIGLEDHASSVYKQFALESQETHTKILFTALSQVEADHLALIKNYL